MSRVPLSVLDLATVGTGTTGAAAIRASVDLAVHVERLGYRRIWYAEHHLAEGVAAATPAVLAAAAAARTSTIRVGSGAVALSSTSPVQAAEQFGTIAALHPGRIDLGLGRAPTTPKDAPKTASWWTRGGEQHARDIDGVRIPAAPVDTRTDAGDAFRERLARRRALLGVAREPDAFGEEVRRILALRDGTATDAVGDPVVSPPAQGTDFEVWLLASSGGESAVVAGELGLPLAANYHVSPFSILETVEAYRRHFRPGALERPYVIVSVDALVAETAAEAARLADGFTDWVLSIRRTAGGAIAYPRPGEGTPPDRLTKDDRGLVRDRLEARFVGDPHVVVERLEALARVTGADELLVTTATHDPAAKRRSFELLAAAWAQEELAEEPPRRTDQGDGVSTTEHDEVPTLEAVQAAVRTTQGAVLVDVRSAAGRAASGAIPVAQLVDRHDLDAVFGPAHAPVISLEQPVVVVCGSEAGSAPVVRALRERGYRDVSQIGGGFPAWRDAGLPTTQPGPA